MNKKNCWGQFYTPPHIATMVVTKSLEFLDKPPKFVLELAAGEGHLLQAMEEFHPQCEVHAVEIDSDNVAILERTRPTYFIHNANATKSLDCIESIKFDLGLGNPPFLDIVIDDYIKKLIEETLEIEISVGRSIRAEYVFICQYMNSLTPNGVLAIILPETIVSGVRSRVFREKLINKWEIDEIVEISGSPFSCTEAKTHVFYIRKNKPNQSYVKLSTFGQMEPVSINKSDLLERMDYSFHKRSLKHNDSYIKLSDCASVKRGSKTHKFLKSQANVYIHSTSFDKDFSVPKKTLGNNDCYLRKGDLIMCRVGSRIVGKVREYKGGPVLFSDCIYRIRFEDKDMKKMFLKYVLSNEGKMSLQNLSRGVCSKYITKYDLNNYEFEASCNPIVN